MRGEFYSIPLHHTKLQFLVDFLIPLCPLTLVPTRRLSLPLLFAILPPSHFSQPRSGSTYSGKDFQVFWPLLACGPLLCLTVKGSLVLALFPRGSVRQVLSPFIYASTSVTCLAQGTFKAHHKAHSPFLTSPFKSQPSPYSLHSF